MVSPVERPSVNSFVYRPQIKGAISFDSVCFSYPGRKEQALDNISFKIAPGEKVAIIGRVGSGKSTLAKLLLGVYKPDEGTICLDGTDVEQIDPTDIRRNIGYVAQEPFLFRGTIKDNICAASPFIDGDKILKASNIAGIDGFINQSPLGFDMPVGERGDGLSGGQRQGVTLARALLKEPTILLLDEPTSSMDSKTEQGLKESLKTYLDNRTLLLTTHKTSMLSLVDRIIVMDRGQIIQDGKREEVLEMLTSRKLSVGK